MRKNKSINCNKTCSDTSKLTHHFHTAILQHIDNYIDTVRDLTNVLTSTNEVSFVYFRYL